MVLNYKKKHMTRMQDRSTSHAPNTTSKVYVARIQARMPNAFDDKVRHKQSRLQARDVSCASSGSGKYDKQNNLQLQLLYEIGGKPDFATVARLTP